MRIIKSKYGETKLVLPQCNPVKSKILNGEPNCTRLKQCADLWKHLVAKETNLQV